MNVLRASLHDADGIRADLIHYPAHWSQGLHRHDDVQLSVLLLGGLREMTARDDVEALRPASGAKPAGTRHAACFGDCGALMLSITLTDPNCFERMVIQPLGMERTGPRVSSDAAAGHEWISAGEWQARTVKADELMHAAGGLVTSPADMARWLTAVARKTGLPAAAFEQAHAGLVDIESDEDGVACQGYALGWRTCLVGAEPVLVHGGGYTGARSRMAVAPRLGVGVAVIANSDGMTGWLSGALVKAFLSAVADPAYQTQDPQAFAASFAARVEEQMQHRRTCQAQAEVEAV